MARLRRSRQGDAIRASDRNDLIDAIEGFGGASVRGGRGLKGVMGGILEFAGSEQMVLIPARVTGAPTATEVEEPDCTYTIRAIHNHNWVLDGHRPGYRLFAGAGILMKPATVGSFCWMVREFDGGGKYTVDAIVLKERFLATFCPDPPAPIAREPMSRREIIENAIKGFSAGGAVGGVSITPSPIPPPSGGFA